MSVEGTADFPTENLIPLAAGLIWLLTAADAGVARLLLGIPPGVLMLSGAVAFYLMPGDLRAPQLIALGAFFGVLFSLPLLFVAGAIPGLTLGLLAAASFVAGGWSSHRREPLYPRVPEPPLDMSLAAKVGLDQLALASISVSRSDALGAGVPERAAEVREALELFRARGFSEKPESFHETPPELLTPSLRSLQVAGHRLEQLSFESGYEPRAEEPGRERWLSHRANRTAHAYVLRASSPTAPWLFCVHGLGMGSARVNLSAFEAVELRRRHGVNVVFPILPLHGPRRLGRRNGEGYVTGDFMDSLHAHAQAAWDMRRLVSWVQGQGATAVGAYGLSLGSGALSVLACLERELHTVVLGIPAVDLARAIRRQASPAAIRAMALSHLYWDDIDELLRPISALAMQPLVPHDGRFIFAGTADHLIPPDQVHDLWKHWDEPRIAWYAGSHLSFRREREARLLLEDALTRLTQPESA